MFNDRIKLCIHLKKPPQLTSAQTARRASPVAHEQPPVISEAEQIHRAFPNSAETAVSAPLPVPVCPSLSQSLREKEVRSPLRAALRLQFTQRERESERERERERGRQREKGKSQPRAAGDDMTLRGRFQIFCSPPLCKHVAAKFMFAYQARVREKGLTHLTFLKKHAPGAVTRRQARSARAHAEFK